MNAQVVEEIVPLPEMFAALLVVTLKNFYDSLRLRILQTVNSKKFGTGNMLLDLH